MSVVPSVVSRPWSAPISHGILTTRTHSLLLYSCVVADLFPPKSAFTTQSPYLLSHVLYATATATATVAAALFSGVSHRHSHRHIGPHHSASQNTKHHCSRRTGCVLFHYHYHYHYHVGKVWTFRTVEQVWTLCALTATVGGWLGAKPGGADSAFRGPSSCLSSARCEDRICLHKSIIVPKPHAGSSCRPGSGRGGLACVQPAAQGASGRVLYRDQ